MKKIVLLMLAFAALAFAKTGTESMDGFPTGVICDLDGAAIQIDKTSEEPVMLVISSTRWINNDMKPTKYLNKGLAYFTGEVGWQSLPDV